MDDFHHLRFGSKIPGVTKSPGMVKGKMLLLNRCVSPQTGRKMFDAIGGPQAAAVPWMRIPWSFTSFLVAQNSHAEVEDVVFCLGELFFCF